MTKPTKRNIPPANYESIWKNTSCYACGNEGLRQVSVPLNNDLRVYKISCPKCGVSSGFHSSQKEAKKYWRMMEIIDAKIKLLIERYLEEDEKITHELTIDKPRRFQHLSTPDRWWKDKIGDDEYGDRINC